MAKLKNWKPEDWEGENVKKRPYNDRRDYVENQQAAHVKRHKSLQRYYQDVERFKGNFEEIHLLRGDGSKTVMCLGCRTGAEVMALRELGHQAYGIDIEPATHSKADGYVIKGDFHDLSHINKWYDIVYTNSFDHVYNLPTALAQVQSILKDDGHFILEVVAGYEEGGCPGDHEAMYWRKAEDFIKEVEKHGFDRVHDIQDVPRCKGLPFKRVILKKTEYSQM